MLGPLDWESCKYKRLNCPKRPSKDGVTIPCNRRCWDRLQCLCRLPLVIIWTLIVIFVVYISIKPSNQPGRDASHRQSQEDHNVEWTTLSSLVEQEAGIIDLAATTISSQLLPRPERQRTVDASDRSSYASNSMATSESDSRSPALSTTRKSPVSEYARQSEIFILLVQNEDMKRRTQRSHHLERTLNLYPSKDSTSSRTANDRNKLVIPTHIKQLMDILDSHRIQYTVDTTQNGMPSQLLDAQTPRKYSVIVVDNFIRYIKLNRWLRDQLDRYCRSNRIGVITYLVDNQDLIHDFNRDADTHRSNTEQLSKTEKRGSRDSTSTDKLLSTEGFPLAFEPIQIECRNLSSTRCLVDYQLNDKTHILRILKQRPNFIVRGQLHAGSVVAMSSNHVTYEALTWARLRGPQSSSLAGRRGWPPPSERNEMNDVQAGTQNADHGHYKGGVVRQYERAIKHGVTNSAESAVGDERLGSTAGEQSISSDGETKNSDATNQRRNANDAHGGPDERKILSMLDHGLFDDIKRVIFGVTNQHWLDRALLLDVIELLSSGEIMTPLERYIQIDIDDIFVGNTGIRLNESDVEALIRTQDEFGRLLEGGFQFQLGFSGKYFKHGNEAEQLGDELLIENADKFSWFCHFWSHSKAHLFNDTEALKLELRKNLEFAQSKKLILVGHSEPLQGSLDEEQTMRPTYAVAPHHSGVYPVHQQLYEAWRSVLNVQVTSTEEYPHLRPARARRGFVHRAIKVLPRQTCGLYTHTIFKDKYPGGFDKLLANIRGGELFQTVLHNPVNVYMTHMSNYANDRLAPLTFRELFKFVQANTNLRLKFAPTPRPTDNADIESSSLASEHEQSSGPLFLADYYFNLYPEQAEPLWTNPCDDKRHRDIWSPRKLALCQLAPRLLIVGPQKTGTTALQWFLSLNPSVRSSSLDPRDFEEVQFFNDKHYLKGSDWYFERFIDKEPSAKNQQEVSGADYGEYFYIDKSATYFDDPKVARRAGALLPDAYIVILLIDPADRAHSWYQHIKAHGDNEIANKMTFDEVIMFDQSDAHQSQVNATSNTGQLRNLAPTSTRVGGRVTDTLDAQHIAAIKALRSRCLQPGYYSSHLLNWLNHYQSRQIIIIDGQWLKYNPMAVLNRLQLLLRLPHRVDYNDLLAYDRSKGFYCKRASAASNFSSRLPARRAKVTGDSPVPSGWQRIDEQQRLREEPRCLGSGKGRKYGAMSERARTFLDKHYRAHNRQLAKLLYEIGQPLPTWLDESINLLPASLRRKH